MQVLGLNPSRNDVADTIARCRGDEGMFWIVVHYDHAHTK